MGVQAEIGIKKIMEIFCDSKIFTDDEISLIEDYFEDGEEEILEKLEYRKEFPIGIELKGVLRWLIQCGEEETVEKAGKLIFAVWESKAGYCFPLHEMFSKKCNVMASEPAIRAALYVSHINGISELGLKELMDYAHNDPEIIIKAFNYRGKSASDGVILLAAYFLMKYPEAGPEDEAGGLEALLEKQGVTGEEARQDIAMMRQYEDLLLSIFSEIFDREPPKDLLDELEKAIRDDRIDERILKMAASLPENSADIYIGKRSVCGMAFINYVLSRRLKNIVLVCLAVRAKEMLSSIADLDMRGDFENRGGSFDLIFGVDSYWLIMRAIKEKKENILREQFERNRDIFLKCMDEMDFTLYHYMSEVIERTDAGFHKEREQEELARQQKLLIKAMTDSIDFHIKEEVQRYLQGETEMESLYPLCEEIWRNENNRSLHWKLLNSYKEFYGYDDLCRKCEATLMICGGFDNIDYLLENGVLKEERVREVFRTMDEMGLAPRFQLKGFTDMYFSLHDREKWRKLFLAVGEDIFGSYYKERRDEMKEAFSKAGRPGRLIALQIYSRGLECPSAEGEKESSIEQVMSFCQDSSGEVRDALVEILYRAKNHEQDVVNLLSSQVPDERKIAIRVLMKWEDDKYALMLKEAFCKEKNAELKALLAAVLPVDKVIRLEGDKGLQDVIKELHKGNKKRTLAWTCETPFSEVHKRDGKEADEKYLQAILLAYAAMEPNSEVVPYGVSSIAKALAGQLDEREYAVYINELLDKWIAAGADTKKRWVLFAAANHGDEDMSGRLFEAIQEWSGKRAPIALEAVRALSLSLRPDALLMVEELSRKSKTNKIRSEAKKALDSTAAWLGLTKSGLMDRTVPDLKFNEKRERVFDYGTRRFIVDITADFEVQAYDESGKKLKNLPAPGKQDDEAKASAAREEFSQLKKQVKTMVKKQKERLEEALSSVRMWRIDFWKELFFGNPVMYRLGMGLIWGFYENGKLAAAFRYREDGIFNMENLAEEPFAGEGLPKDGEAFTEREVFIEEVRSIEEMLAAKGSSLPEGIKVGLVHPLELSQASLEAWKKDLKDCGVVQSIEQLDRPVYRMTEEEADKINLERFKGMIMKGKVIQKELRASGWSNDHAIETHYEEIFNKENQELSIGVTINMEERFEDYYEGGRPENVTLDEVRFYDLSDDYGEAYILKDVPERYFSEVVLELTKATAECIRRDVNYV